MLRKEQASVVTRKRTRPVFLQLDPFESGRLVCAFERHIGELLFMLDRSRGDMNIFPAFSLHRQNLLFNDIFSL